MSDPFTAEDDGEVLIDRYASFFSWFPRMKMELMLRSWRRDGRAIALGAALGVLVLVLVAAAAALLGAGPGPRPPRDPFVSVADVLRGRYFPRSFNATWMPQHKLMFQDKKTAEPLLLDPRDGMALSLLPDKSILKGIDVFKYIVSPDIKYLLLMHNITFAGINSFEAYYELLDREKRTRRPVVGACGARLLQKTTWAPRGGAFAFVQGNDLFYVANAAASELRPLRLTNTGVPDRVYNGLPCFSYDKVVFWSRPAMWFSPDGRYLAWASFDDTAVGTVMLPFYFPSRSLYADNLTIRYPLPGTALPEVSLWLVDVREAARTGAVRPLRLDVPQELRPGVALLGGAQWASAHELVAVWANRRQDHLKLAAYNASAATAAALDPSASQAQVLRLSELVYLLESRDSGAADLRTRPIFSSDGRSAVLPEPLLGAAWGGAWTGGGGGDGGAEADAEAEGGGAARPGAAGSGAGTSGGHHGAGPPLLLVRRNPTEGFRRTVLTKGPIAARVALAWDERAHRVYFLGSGRGDPGQQHLWSVSDAAVGAPHEPRCESCSLRLPHTEPGACRHASADFDTDRPPRFFALTCNGPGVPETAIFALDNDAPTEAGPAMDTTTSENSGSTSGSSNGEDGGDGGGGGNGRNNGSSGGDSGAGDSGGSGGSGGIRVAMSWESQAPLRARIAATVLPWEMRAELPLRHGRRARLRLWLPPNYDVAKAKYPLLLDMNEEWDGGPRASERFTVDWRAHLAANRSVVYAVVAAGAGPPHKGIGQDDVDDQLHAIRELVERFNYIDAARVGVWGWSRGGYLAAMTMARDAAKLVRCAIAVAPVVNWHYYNALYTERYLHLPDDNAAGYARADLSQHAEGLRGKRLLLAHGSLDSLVHLRHSLALAMELHDLDVPFDFQLYPDEEHALSGVKSHLFRKMERFLEECFPLD